VFFWVSRCDGIPLPGGRRLRASAFPKSSLLKTYGARLIPAHAFWVFLRARGTRRTAQIPGIIRIPVFGTVWGNMPVRLYAQLSFPTLCQSIYGRGRYRGREGKTWGVLWTSLKN